MAPIESAERDSLTRVVLTVWGDPAIYLVIPPTCRKLSETGIRVELIYRLPNTDVDVFGRVDFGSGTRLVPIGQGSSGWRDKVAYIAFVLKTVRVAWQSKPVAF